MDSLLKFIPDSLLNYLNVFGNMDKEKRDLYLIVIVFLAFLFLVTEILLLKKNNNEKKKVQLPPTVPYLIPFIGSAVQFGIDPVKFLQEQKKKFGDCFTFKMLGRNMTFCLGSEGNNFVFNVKLKDATAEGAYLKLTRPVFGTEVVYDVENSVFMEQKKFVKDALSTAAFKTYLPTIIQETKQMFMKEFEKSEFTVELFPVLAELTIRTASSCLMGKEIRDQLHSNVAKLFHDLDCGLTPLNVFVEYLPLPRFINRDRANKELTELFLEIIKKRKLLENDPNVKYEKKFDVLESLMNSDYKSGSKMSDVAVSHMMIALLMAGQHTSSTTGSWFLFELAKNPELQKKIREEHSMILTGKTDTPKKDLPDLTFETLKQCTFLDNCLKETLRIHPPIHTVMRLVEQDLNYNGLTIPKGNFLCSGITVGHLDEVKYPDPLKFDPSRHVLLEESGEWTIGNVDIQQKSARNLYLPFGAGRHRCIGEHFAFIQLKTIVATIVNEFDLELVDNKFPEIDYTQLIVLPVKGSLLRFKRRT
ncbi:Lanosterol 14-alpha-demethylase [Lobulomyces angularis]|nr:Lanosterol 14-alpha-demethylase [Lobulomyces angularis]